MSRSQAVPAVIRSVVLKNVSGSQVVGEVPSRGELLVSMPVAALPGDVRARVDSGDFPVAVGAEVSRNGVLSNVRGAPLPQVNQGPVVEFERSRDTAFGIDGATTHRVSVNLMQVLHELRLEFGPEPQGAAGHAALARVGELVRQSDSLRDELDGLGINNLAQLLFADASTERSIKAILAEFFLHWPLTNGS